MVSSLSATMLPKFHNLKHKKLHDTWADLGGPGGLVPPLLRKKYDKFFKIAPYKTPDAVRCPPFKG